MARLLNEPIKPQTSKSEKAGEAATKLRLRGYLNLPGAAAYLQVHKYTVREFIEKGFIESVKIGTREHITEDELRRIKGLLEKHGSLAKAWKAVTSEAAKESGE